MPKSSNPNSVSTSSTVAHVCSSSFVAAGKHITVTMIDPEIDPEGKQIPRPIAGTFTPDSTQVVHYMDGSQERKIVIGVQAPSTWGRYWDATPDGLAEPFEVVGNYCPATFRVDGLKFSITFRTGFKHTDEADKSLHTMMDSFTGKSAQSRIVITSITAWGGPVERKYLANIPTAALLDHALHASTFIGTAYPPNYRIVVNGVTTFDSGPTVDVIAHTVGVRSRTTKHLRYIEGVKPPGRKAYSSSWHSPELIDAAVEFYNSCPDGYPGGRTEYVRTHLETKTGYRYAASTISRMFAKAREDGKLPPVPEKYKYKNQKRGAK